MQEKEREQSRATAQWVKEWMVSADALRRYVTLREGAQRHGFSHARHSQ
ncbi:hypothetical protein [Tengunoibacter tsumagoiensis]|nr:hypothetical protein [Tengunoibacter tsumagoiensis]